MFPDKLTTNTCHTTTYLPYQIQRRQTHDDIFADESKHRLIYFFALIGSDVPAIHVLAETSCIVVIPGNTRRSLACKYLRIEMKYVKIWNTLRWCWSRNCFVHFSTHYSGTSPYGHLTGKNTSPLQSPWLSPKLYSTVQITPVIRSPLH